MYAETTRENLRRIVDAYCEAKTQATIEQLTRDFKARNDRDPNSKERRIIAQRSQMTPMIMSRRFYGSSNGLSDFLKGRIHVTVDRLDQLIFEIWKAWPAGAEWPECDPVLMQGGRLTAKPRKPRQARQREKIPVDNLVTA